MIVVLDYGMGNLPNVQRAIRHLGFQSEIRPNVGDATKLILPGVGAFGAAMARLAPLKGEILEFAANGNPMMGICLGQQLLMESSEEMGEHEGLGLVPGRVRYLPRDEGLKIPHMGWNSLVFAKDTPMAKDFQAGGQVFFVHSLYTDCSDAGDVAAWSEHGIRFPAAIQRGNVWGTQFHPEKSGAVGLGILRNFLEC